jgi:outer membrane protein TolC
MKSIDGIHFRIFALLLLLASPDVAAQGVDTLFVSDPAELVRVAIERNQDLKSLRFRTQQMEQSALQVGVLPDPTLGLVALPFPVFTARGAQRAQVQLSQSIPFPGKLELKEEAMEWAAKASYFSEETFKLDLIEQVRSMMVDIKLIRRQKSLIEQYQLLIRNFESVAETRYRVGKGSQQAILKAQLERNALSSRTSALDQSINSILRVLSTLVDQPIALSPNINDEWDEVWLTKGDVRMALESRTELKSLQAQSMRAESLEELAKKEWRPDFSVGMSYFNITNEPSPPGANGRDALAISFGLKIPIQRKRLNARLEESRLLQQEVNSRTYRMQRQVSEEISEYQKNISLLIEQRSLFESALIPQAQTTLESTISAYTTGETGFLDLLDAERMVFDLSWQLEVISARLEKQVISLERSLGSNQEN